MKTDAIPNPIAIIGMTSVSYDVSPEILDTISRPPTAAALPMIGHGLHLPVFAISRPIPNVPSVTPIIWGSIRRPDSVGDTNNESWK